MALTFRPARGVLGSILACGVAVALAAPSGEAAQATTPTGLAITAPVPDLDLAVAEFNRLVPDQVKDGMLSLSGADQAGTLTVRWKAPVPKEVSQLAGTDLDGFVVKVLASDVSQSDVLGVADKILAASAAGILPGVAYVVASADGAGVSVHVPPDVLEARGAKALTAIFEAFTGTPVLIGVGQTPQPTYRMNDADPWRGGMMYQWPTYPTDYEFCSTSFAVVGPGGYGHLLSARHCDPSGDRAFEDANNDDFSSGGAQVDIKAVDDTMRINPIGGTQPYVYGGGPAQPPGTANYTLGVVGADTAAEGGIVCSDGANSGMHCGLVVFNDPGDTGLATWSCGPSTCHGWKAQIIGPPSGPATVGGDSGGPVFHNWGNDTVGARGVIWGGSGSIACGTVNRAVSNCYSSVWFNDITRVLNAWNVTIKTIN